MLRSARIVLFVTVALTLPLVGLTAWFLMALRHVPDFYAQAMAGDPKHQAQASQDLVKQSAALIGDTQKEGAWRALFTADEINSWLAVELARNHQRLLPPKFENPRIAVQAGALKLACQYQGPLSTILSVEIEAYLSEPDVIALRLKRARAGAVPMPLRQIIDGISTAAVEADLHLEWRQIDGDPVALIRFSPQARQQGARLESLEVRDGAIYVAGSTAKRQR